MAIQQIFKLVGKKFTKFDKEVDSINVASLVLSENAQADSTLTRTALVAHIAHVAAVTGNPHSVTKAEVLSGNLIVNADVDAAAAIVESKLALTYSTSSLDSRITALVGGQSFGEYTKVITGDIAPADDATLSTLLPFGDDDAPQLVIGDFAADDYIMFDFDGTPKLLKVYDDTGTLKVTSVGVDQPTEGKCYHVQYNMPAGANALEKRAIYGKTATIMIKIADEVWDTAAGILLGSWASGAGVISGSDSVLSALQKADGNTAAHTGSTSNPHSVTKSQVLSGNLIVNADIDAAAAIADTKLAQLTTADKVAGSAVQLNSEASIENSTGLRVTNTEPLINNEGGAVTLGQVGIIGTDGKFVLVNNTEDVDFEEMRVVAIASIADQASGAFYMRGAVVARTGTAGKDLWLDTTDGVITETQPTAGEVVYLGRMNAAGTAYRFNPRYIVSL